MCVFPLFHGSEHLFGALAVNIPFFLLYLQVYLHEIKRFNRYKEERECFGNDGNALLSSLCFLSFGSNNSLLAAGETTPTGPFSLPLFWKRDVS